jgi:FKBP-type peptidyl-prolyl cis-trans isomerase FklB
MQLKIPVLITTAAISAISLMAQDAKIAKPPDKQNLSYALGMNLALEMKGQGIEVDPAIISKAINDVLQNNQTEIKESEIPSILRQAETAARFNLSSKYIADGEAFLAKNAAAPGITVLPDGVQYRVLKTGSGNFPKRIEIVTLNFRGTWTDGTEFKHNERLELPFWGCPQGLQEAMLKMRVGSKWQIFVPYTLAYGHVGEQAERFGSPLIYELELLNSESETAHPNQHHSTGRLGHTMDEDLVPAKAHSTIESAH